MFTVQICKVLRLEENLEKILSNIGAAVAVVSLVGALLTGVPSHSKMSGSGCRRFRAITLMVTVFQWVTGSGARYMVVWVILISRLGSYKGMLMSVGNRQKNPIFGLFTYARLKR